MARKIIFPITVAGKVFETHKKLYDFYYSCDPSYLTEFGKYFLDEGINLVELVHWPESFTIIEMQTS